MADSARLPELVRDSKLEATFSPTIDNPDTTIHSKLIDRRTKQTQIWYREKRLGHGGYGVVWLERGASANPTPYKFRAVKELMTNKRKVKRGDYLRELEALTKFSQDKYVDFFVKCYGWYESQRALFIAMEFCEHGDLKDHLLDQGPLPEGDAQEIAFQVLSGLKFMHENGFAHRDLKPANILINEKPPRDWRVKICDLGLSRRIEGDNPSTTVKGTPGFMAPELIFDLGINPRRVDPQPADMWCIGETIYFMLTCQTSFRGELALLQFVQGSDLPLQLLEEAGVTIDVINLLGGLIVPEPYGRLTAAEALTHAWLEPALEVADSTPSDYASSNTGPGGRLSSQDDTESLVSGYWTETVEYHEPPPNQASRPCPESPSKRETFQDDLTIQPGWLDAPELDQVASPSAAYSGSQAWVTSEQVPDPSSDHDKSHVSTIRKWMDWMEKSTAFHDLLSSSESWRTLQAALYDQSAQTTSITSIYNDTYAELRESRIHAKNDSGEDFMVGTVIWGYSVSYPGRPDIKEQRGIICSI